MVFLADNGGTDYERLEDQELFENPGSGHRHSGSGSDAVATGGTSGKSAQSGAGPSHLLSGLLL